ncbi:uncharacterized protein N7483_003724 [Penicillium malachiteum]|uniref:uncharacterized protein n=1 Tax=Penicillium malachiteum TaxID=1324776 RepID=UPI00254955E5|nr:uncharacterized protein N7483_003724 [Penicillium malachiteum]KAJ5729216.1 hypothetical protein N7483_003724 [Penicillium malachiteum]
MKRLLYISTAFLIPLVHGWTFLYTNSSGQSTILEETGKLNCTKIQLAEDKLFTWDPKKRDLCISIYYDESCDNRGGISCPFWKKNASTNFGSIAVFTNNEAASASVSTMTMTSTASTSSSSSSSTTDLSNSTTSVVSFTSPVTPTSSTAAPAAASDGTSSTKSDSGLSGGAIAGIVIGAIAGVLIIAALSFFFRRRNRKNATLANQQSGSMPQAPYGRPIPGTATSFAATSPSTTHPAEKESFSSSGIPTRPPPGSTMSELSGHTRPVELVNTPISELDAQPQQKISYPRPLN